MYYKNVYKYDEMKRAEHTAVRSTVGWYYFTHNLVEVVGKDSAQFLDRLFVNPVANLAVGRDRYTTMLNEDGDIIDDVVILRLEENKFWVSTLYPRQLIAWFDGHKADEDVAYQDVTSQYDMYSVQGPKSKELISGLVRDSVDDMKFFSIADNVIDGIPVKINRGGFTGEKLGYEIYVAPEQKKVIEAKLREAAEPLGGRQVTEF